MTVTSPVSLSSNAKFAHRFDIDQIVNSELLVPQFHADSKIGAIKELIDKMHEQGVITDSLSFLQSVLEREQLQSTILGGEVAMPHARSRCVRDLGLAMGIAHRPIDFPSGDERHSVRLICLIAVPAHAPDLYLNLLGSLARTLSDQERRAALIAAESAAEMQALLLDPIQ
ncbi:MAG: PTS system fructose-specific IIC component [Candidatus Latescibacterota bacterium]